MARVQVIHQVGVLDQVIVVVAIVEVLHLVGIKEMQLVKSYRIFIDEVELEKSTATITCHPFIFSIGLFRGDIQHSFVNARVEEVAKKYKLKERIETLGSEVKSKVLEKYSDRCITKDLIKSIENDLRKIIFTVRTIYPDFDQFYRESLYA
ncbi:hypothetical protein [Acinetobacter baumannii]|uniref:hypothetical protein n=2 Tax=Acinetobacter TaxID=469 RepID=UPI001FFCD8B0|nr:hypothetical protein [Acinetobacter baumannii]